MRITASKLDDLLKNREEYDAQVKELEDRQENLSSQYRMALRAKCQELEKKVSDMIGPTSLDLQIRVEQGWKVNIRANDRDHFDPKRALSWSMDIVLNDSGEVKKDSSSWSGLRAVTDEQISDLEESVRVIKVVNSINWPEALNEKAPNYDDYTEPGLREQIRDKKANRPKFEENMLDLRLEELIGQDIAIKLRKDQYYSGTVYMLVTSMSPKFVTGYIFPTYMADSKTADEIRRWAVEPRRSSRENIVVDKGMPVEVPLKN